MNIADATEFSRRHSLPHVEVRHMSTKNTMDVVLTLGGREIGSKTEITKRGKVVQTLFVLPALV